MDEQPSAGRGIKFFPRNKTARARRRIIGNPVSSRPESGVENSFPGLEFDTRSFERVFFPGLVFEFFQSDGITLVDVLPGTHGLAREDLEGTEPIYLWSIGLPGQEEVDLRVVEGSYAMGSWRHVRALDKGPIAVVVGRGPKRNVILAEQERNIAGLFTRIAAGEAWAIVRDPPTGPLNFAIIAAHRNSLLTDSGVIDAAGLPPGELTKTMCSPWVYDFQECHCFYWASNKPDLTDPGEEQRHPINFLRADRESSPPPVDRILDSERGPTSLSVKALIEGAWRDLPLVIDDQENIGRVEPAAVPLGRPLSRESVIARLSYLATVEHALMVEYLFAYYSLKKEPDPTVEPEVTHRIRLAADEIFSVAVDEMRHFLWVNRVLTILGGSPSMGRAVEIREPPSDDPASGYPRRPFALRPLNRATLQDFIDVERPSQSHGEGVDGLYVQLLIEFQRPEYPLHEQRRIVPLIKLIVDEGNEHFQRFEAMRIILGSLAETTFARTFNAEPEPSDEKYLELCDTYYNGILIALELNFLDGEKGDTEILAGAVRSMHNFDRVASIVAARNVPPRFRINRAPPADGYSIAWTQQAMRDPRPHD